MENVNQFIEQLLKDKGLPKLDEEVHKQLVSDLSARLIDFINRKLIEVMPEQDINSFIELLDEDPISAEKIERFIDEKVPNKQRVTTDAMVEFRSLYLGNNSPTT
ncbi:MAG TPA: DUF5663 domain-containing protein [Candidatus Saccharimonadales bacterium]|nr:DUF5663 domain-containing protein [Candidatus Saccharimonadales bacterium]